MSDTFGVGDWVMLPAPFSDIRGRVIRVYGSGPEAMITVEYSLGENTEEMLTALFLARRFPDKDAFQVGESVMLPAPFSGIRGRVIRVYGSGPEAMITVAYPPEDTEERVTKGFFARQLRLANRVA